MFLNLFIICHHGDIQPSHNKFKSCYVKNSRVHRTLLHYREKINTQLTFTRKKAVRILLMPYENIYFQKNISVPYIRPLQVHFRLTNSKICSGYVRSVWIKIAERTHSKIHFFSLYHEKIIWAIRDNTEARPKIKRLPQCASHWGSPRSTAFVEHCLSGILWFLLISSKRTYGYYFTPGSDRFYLFCRR